MPLDKMEIRVPFGGGVDTKTDPKQVIPGKLLELKNGTFQKSGQITKREAFEVPFSDDTVDGDTIEGGNAIYRRGKELLITGLQTSTDTGRIAWEDGRHMFSHGPDENEWKIIGEREPLRIETKHITSSRIEWDIPDMALADSNKYACYVYISGGDNAYQPGVTYYNRGHVTVRELANDNTLIDDWIYDSAPVAAVNVSGIHVTGIDGVNPRFYVWLAVPSTNDIYLSIINCLTLSAVGVPVLKIDDLHADLIWDVCTATHSVHGICTVIAYKESANGFLRVRWFDEDGTLQATQTGTMVIRGACTVYEAYDRLTTSNKVVTSYQNNATGFIYGTTFNADNSVYIGGGWDFAIYSADAGIVHKMTGCKDTAMDHYTWPARSYVRLYVEIEVKEGGALLDSWWQSRILELQHQFDGTNPNTASTNRHARLASKAFEYESRPRVWVVHDSSGALVDAAPDVYSNTYQNTFFLCSLGDFINHLHQRTEARCYGGEAGVNGQKSISAVMSPSTNRYSFAAKKQERSIEFDSLGDGGSTRRSQDSIVEISTDFDQYAQPSTELGPTIQTGGGFVGEADGRFQENNFHLYPMIKEITAAGGGTGADVHWSYCAVFEWMDREGQRHQSAPSIPVDIECKDDEQVTIEFMSLSFGDWEKLNNTRVVIYRTETGPGLIYYRLPAESCPLNTPLTYTGFAYDGGGLGVNPITDAILIENETLYTTGGVVENICPPASSIMNVYQDRVVLVPDEDRTNLWFSKIKQHEVGVSFSDLFTKRITDGGDTTALCAMDSREIVFKESQIRAFSGDGPIDTGVGSFSEDYLITADVGCCDRASVVWTDKGIMFKSLKGIYLLGRNLQVAYVGAPVEEYNQYHVLKAELVETKNQVRFLLEGSVAMLVYDYLVDQWSVFDSPYQGDEVQLPWNTVDSAMWQNQYVMVRDDGTVLLETDAYRDLVSTYIPLDLTTSWIKLNGLQGYQRVWWISLLGEVYDRCAINYEIFYNYVDTNPQTGSVVVDANFAANPPAQFRIKPRFGSGKCQAFKIRLYDATATGATNYKGFAISDVMVQIGKKSGVMRQGGLKTR